MVIIFDDDIKFRNIYREMFPKMNIQLQTKECSTKTEMRAALTDDELMQKAKVLIFDLSSTDEEAKTLHFDILKDIEEKYGKCRVPIFIHSAFAEQVPNFDRLGTLFKVKKSSDSAEGILNKIKLFYDSGFLDIFSPGGVIETELHQELHRAFISQFVGEEVEQILQSINHANPKEMKDRTRSVFMRIAVRSLFQNLMAGKVHETSGNFEEIRINAVEHYYRRRLEPPVWTGDVFRQKTGDQRLVVLTPRCDITNGYCRDRYLVCRIEPIEEKKLKDFGKDSDRLKAYVDDNPQNTGHKFRYLVPTPAFSGGKIDLTDYMILDQKELQSKFAYEISLSDELTNDVVRKFASYILRGGISASELGEASFYSKNK